MSYFLSQEDSPSYLRGVAWSGGGGSTGKVSFPTHMEETHQEWLGWSSGATAMTTDLAQVMNAALASNPLNALSYGDPSTDITEWESEYASWNTAVDGLDEHVDVDAIIGNAVAQVDTAGVLNDVDVNTIITGIRTSTANTLAEVIKQSLSAIDGSVLAELVNTYVNARRKQRAEMRTQYKAGMANIGAERSSAYAIGLALLEIDFEREVGQFQTEVSTNMYNRGFDTYLRIFSAELSTRINVALAEKQTRDQFVMNTMSAMLQYKQFIVELQKQLATVLAELHRLKFAMDSEYVANTADLNWKHDSWDFEVYQQGINVLGGIGGGTHVPKGPTKAGSAIGGTLSGAGMGASTGAMIGAAGGPIGALGGAAIGAGLGLAAGLFG